MFSIKCARWLVLTPLALLLSGPCAAIDLIPDMFKRPEITEKTWKLEEQYVGLAPIDKAGPERYPDNEHPVVLPEADIRDALRSLQLWVDGGFFRDEESQALLAPAQIDKLARYAAQALARAQANQDVVFNVRGYSRVVLDVAKERHWTSGRMFYVGGKLNLIIGTYQLKKDKGIRQAEGAAGIIDNYSDLRFDHGSRSKVSKMPGGIVNTTGVQLHQDRGELRLDWVEIDLPEASLAYREAQVPAEERKRELKAQAEAAKLTLEQRQMREEMARLRKEIGDLRDTGASARSVEDRLATLEVLRSKALITDEEYRRRRDEILQEI